jgi:L-fucose isomerase
MKRHVDIYLPLDSRDEPNAEVWPIAKKQLTELIKVIEKCGWKANVLNPDKPISSVTEGMKVIKKAKGSRFIDFMAGWAYPDFTVSPLWQVPEDIPKLMLGSAIPDYPGAVGLLAAAAGTSQMGIRTSRLFVEDFKDHEKYREPLRTFLEKGEYTHEKEEYIDIRVANADLEKAKNVLNALSGSLYGAVGPRSMQMWNKISDADFLRYFGIAREGFDGLRLLKMTEKIPDTKAEKAFEFLIHNGMDIRLGKNPKKHLTKEMVLFQMKVYYALLELRKQFGLDFMGVQDQLDWIEHYPATDLTLGILNNRLRPDSDGNTFVVATEADDGAALTMQVLKLLGDNSPVGFNDLRYWDSKQSLYWFVNSGSLAPYFAKGSHESLNGSWSERQTYMYFKKGGGTCSLVARVPGTVTWARFSYKNHKLYLCAGRGVTDIPTEEIWRERSKNCSPDWPHWYLKLCGKIENHINSNHPMTVMGDYLAELKALAETMDIEFECYDTKKPEQLL